jgi:HD-like signal output (HDOD) protein
MATLATKEIVLGTVSIPTVPDAVVRLNAVLEDPDAGVADIGKAVAQDPAITAKALSIANSSFYGLREPATSAERAAIVLGTRVIRNIVLQASLIQNYEHIQSTPEVNIDDLWRHSILTARLCRAVAERWSRPSDLGPEDLYTCGLLHDLGRIILLDSKAEEYIQVLQEARQRKKPTAGFEVERFGFSHADVGGMVAFLWKLPEKIREALEYHHGPRSKIDADPIVAAVVLADQLANRVQERAVPTAQKLAESPEGRKLAISANTAKHLIDLAVESWPAIEV